MGHNHNTLYVARPTRHLREQRARTLRREKWLTRALVAIMALGTLAAMTGCPGRWPIVIVKGGSGAGEG